MSTNGAGTIGHPYTKEGREGGQEGGRKKGRKVERKEVKKKGKKKGREEGRKMNPDLYLTPYTKCNLK